MRKHLAILTAMMTAAVITACGNGDGIVINGTTAAEAEAGAGVSSEEESGESQDTPLQESKSDAKIQIITGENQGGAETESGAQSLESQVEYQATQAPAQTQTPTQAPTQASTTAAPKATQAPAMTASTTAAAQYEVKDTKKTMYATSSVRVRSSYSTNSEVLGALADGEKIEVTGESSNGWMRVNYKGSTAYVSKSYLTDTPPATKSTTTNQSSKPSSTVNAGTTPGGTTGPTASGGSSGNTTGPTASGGSSGSSTGPSASGSSSGSTTGPAANTSSGSSTGPGGSSNTSSGSSQLGSTGTVTGTVVGLDPTGITLQTSDGTSYQFVWGSNVPALSTGEKVQVQYGVDGSGQRQITQVVK